MNGRSTEVELFVSAKQATRCAITNSPYLVTAPRLLHMIGIVYEDSSKNVWYSLSFSSCEDVYGKETFSRGLRNIMIARVFAQIDQEEL